jgi:hypothetical protein
MSRIRFVMIIIVCAGISLSAIAATRLSTHRVSPPVAFSDHWRNDAADNFEECVAFPQPIGLRRTAPVVRPLEIIQCSAR